MYPHGIEDIARPGNGGLVELDTICRMAHIINKTISSSNPLLDEFFCATLYVAISLGPFRWRNFSFSFHAEARPEAH